MTCQEVREYFDCDMRIGPNPESSPPPEIGEHVARCPRCYRVAAEKNELHRTLQLLRDAALLVPASLDGVVLANYREQVRDLRYMANRDAKRGIALAPLGWAGAIVVIVLMVSYGVRLVSSRNQYFEHARSRPSAPPIAGKSEAAPSRHSAAISGKPRTIRMGRARQTARTLAKRRNYAPETAAEPTLLAPEFQGLMYCDQLSCAGAMDVIRVRVTAGSLRRSSTSLPASALVAADILVGPDGVARGIRVAK